jgi:hypothetical protein
MPLTAELLARHVQAVAPDYPATIVLAGASVVGTVSPAEMGDVLGEDGVEPVRRVEFCAPLSEWPRAPREKRDRVTYDGSVWTVESAVADLGAYTVRLAQEQ